MFNDMLPNQGDSGSMLPEISPQIMRQVMDDLDDKKKKHHSKGKKRHRNRKGKNAAKDKSISYSQSDLYRLSFCLGAMQAKNKMLENMMRLALATQKKTLRTDVIDVGFEILDDGKA